MLTTISWAEYTAGAAILLTIYYAFVTVKYFSGDLINLVSGKRKGHLQALAVERNGTSFMSNDDPDDDGQSIAVNNQSETEETDLFSETMDKDMDEVEELIGRVTRFIEEASQSNALVEDFKANLKKILDKYPGIKDSPLRPSVNELVVSECEKYGAVTLTEEEIDELWENDI